MKSNGKYVLPNLKRTALLLGVVGSLILSFLFFAPSAHAVPHERSVNFNTSQVKNNCAHAKGHVSWDGGEIGVFGLFDQFNRCSGASYLYLSFDSGGHHYNYQVGKSVGRTTNVNSFFNKALNVAHIALTVCSTQGGWHCGTPLRF